MLLNLFKLKIIENYIKKNRHVVVFLSSMASVSFYNKECAIIAYNSRINTTPSYGVKYLKNEISIGGISVNYVVGKVA